MHGGGRRRLARGGTARQLSTPADDLGREWRAGGLSNEFLFSNARHLEQQRAQLRNDQARHALRAKRRSIDVEDIRRRLYATEEEGGFDIMQKRSLVREALHAVIVYPTARPAHPTDFLQLYL